VLSRCRLSFKYRCDKLFCLQEYNQHIQDLKEEMEEATKSAQVIREEIQAFRNRYNLLLPKSEQCKIYRLHLLQHFISLTHTHTLLAMLHLLVNVCIRYDQKYRRHPYDSQAFKSCSSFQMFLSISFSHLCLKATAFFKPLLSH
jgi:hypothetical protein